MAPSNFRPKATRLQRSRWKQALSNLKWWHSAILFCIGVYGAYHLLTGDPSQKDDISLSTEKIIERVDNLENDRSESQVRDSVEIEELTKLKESGFESAYECGYVVIWSYYGDSSRTEIGRNRLNIPGKIIDLESASLEPGESPADRCYIRFPDVFDTIYGNSTFNNLTGISNEVGATCTPGVSMSWGVPDFEMIAQIIISEKNKIVCVIGCKPAPG